MSFTAENCEICHKFLGHLLLALIMSTDLLNQISPHVYWLPPDSATDRPVLGVVAGSRGSLIVDAGNSPAHTHLLLEEIAKQGIAPPLFAMLTHWHWDHVFGSSALQVPTFAHYETRRIVTLMAQMNWSDAALDERVENGTEIPFCRDMMKLELPNRENLVIRPPDIGFNHEVEIDLGGVTCHLLHVGGDHAHDSSVVYVPEDKVMFLGDCIYHDLYHGPGRYTTTNLFPLLNGLWEYEVNFYLPGHHVEPLSRAQFNEEIYFLKTIGRLVGSVGDDRQAGLELLRQVFGTAVSDDHVEVMDMFLAGLRLPDVKPVF